MLASPQALETVAPPAFDIEDQTAALPRDRGVRLRDAFDLLSPADLAELIGVDTRTLAIWRCQCRGPDFVKLGRAVFYRRTDVQAWVGLNVQQTDRAVT
jgi:hypothetical protein